MDKAPECPWELTVWDLVVQETQEEALNSQPSLDVDRATRRCRKFTVCCGCLNLKSVGTVLELLSGSNDRGGKLLLRISMCRLIPNQQSQGTAPGPDKLAFETGLTEEGNRHLWKVWQKSPPGLWDLSLSLITLWSFQNPGQDYTDLLQNPLG